MQNGQVTIYDLFDGTKIFIIPKYQRAYAWDTQQLRDFVDDLENQKADKAYFFGTILFQSQPDDGYFKMIDIVDGQQRLTTVIIFMKLLVEQLKAHGEDTTLLEETYLQRYGAFKLRVLEQDNGFFQSYILQGHPVVEGVITTPSQHRLLAAQQYLAERLGAYSLEELQVLQEKLRRTRVLAYGVDNTADATLIFETTNDRGKGLTNLEKTKSFLMYKAYLAFEHPESHLDFIQSQFSELYRDYEDIQGRIGEDTILQYHFIAFERWMGTREDKDYYHYMDKIKQKINRLIAGEDRQQAGTYIEKYARELRETFAIMKKLLSNHESYLSHFFAVGRPAMFYPLLIKTWKYDQSEDKQAFRRVVRLAEIHAFRVIGMGRRRSDTGRETVYGYARDFMGDFDKLTQDLKNMIEYYSDMATFRGRLLSPHFYKNTYGNDMRYLFWQYENYLRCSRQPLATPMSYQAFSNQDRQMRLTIEHIAAQNPKANVVEDISVLPEITEKFAETYLHCLGNLTFDPLAANASKSNNDVQSKVQRYFRLAPFKTQNELDTFINPETGKWDAWSVEKRREKIVNFALAHWDPHSL